MNLRDVAQDSAVLQHATLKAQNGPISLNVPPESNSLLFSQELTLRLVLCFEFK